MSIEGTAGITLDRVAETECIIGNISDITRKIYIGKTRAILESISSNASQ
jgi:hypothetical protein